MNHCSRVVSILLALMLFLVLPVQAQLNGTYSVGTGNVGGEAGHYATLAAAFADLNLAAITGPVTFEITSDLAETGSALVITSNAGASATNLITIKPASGVQPTITITGATATAGATQYTGLTLNNASYVTIDGSNNGTTSRDLTIKMNDGTNGRIAVQLYANCDYVTIKNTKITWQAMNSATTTTVVYANGLAAGACDSLVIQNNDFSTTTANPYYSVRITGYSTGSIYATKVYTLNNVLASTMRTVYYYYVGTAGTTSEISGNTIAAPGTAITGYVVYGILMNTYNGTIVISKNKISNLRINSATGQGLYGISTLTGQTGNQVLMYNNVITDVALLNATTSTPVAGVYFQDAINATVRNNSINLSPVTYTTGIAAAFRNGSTSTVTLHNNAIVNAHNSANAYAYYRADTSKGSSDYNDMFVSGASASVGNYIGTVCTALSTWVTATSQDNHSVSADPLFTSVTDLSIGGASPLRDAGTDLGIATDFLGNGRVGTTDIGAYEYQAPPPPSDPVATAATSVSYTSFSANWGAASGATSYLLDVSTANDFSTFVTGYSSLNVGNVTTYSVTGLADNTTYYYRVRAYNGETSGNSNTISLTTLTLPSFAGEYYIGTAGTHPMGGDPDYLSLKAACDALNGGKITGDVVMYFTSSLTETENVALGVATNGYKITFKPYSGTTVNIHFTQTADNAGPSGTWVIGSSATASYSLVATNNVVIDGSNAENGTTRDLSLTNDENAVTYFYGIRIVGNSDSVTVKNVSMTVTETGSSSSYAIAFSARNNGADRIPDFGTVDNCDITITGGTACQGIAITPSSTPAAGTGSNGMVFKNNTITARTRGIFINCGYGVTVTGNTFNIAQTGSGVLSHGVYVYSTNSVTSHTTTIAGNKFLQLATANVVTACGIAAISLDQPGTYRVYNNMITGFDQTAASTLGIRAGIRINTNSASFTGHIYFNSIFIGDDAELTGSDAGGIAGIAITNASYAGSTTIMNNIIVLENTPTCYGIYRANSAGTFVSEYNDFYTPGAGGNVGAWAGTAHATLSAWQTASSGDALSANLNPGFGGATTWTSTSDLHWTGKPAGAFGGTPLGSPYDKDFDGDTRDGAFPYMGADEIPGQALPVEMSGVTAEVSAEGVTLNWSTASEVENAGFEVERRLVSASDWLRIGFVAGAGTSNEVHAYAFADQKVAPGKYAYRLKQVDKGGAYKYSASVEIEVLAPRVFALSGNYPNPFNPSTTLEFTVKDAGQTSLKVYDVTGREVASLFDGVAEPEKMYRVTFEAQRLASGVYYARLTSAGTQIVRRMMLMK